MASSDQQDFSETERAALLQEILKTFLQDPNHTSYTLASAVRALDIHPVWDNIPPPPGRTLGQCKNVFQDIMSGAQLQRPYIYSRSVTGQHMPPPLLGPPPPMEYGSSQRVIMPRPLPPTQSLTRDSPSSPFSPATSEPQDRRPKRGRPNRSESERRQRAREEAAARGEKDPYPSRSRKKARIEPGSAVTTQGPTPASAARPHFGIAISSSMPPSTSGVTFTTAPEAYSYSRTILPPLHSSAPGPSPIPGFSRAPYQPTGPPPATRSSQGNGTQSASPGQLPVSLPPSRSLRSYSSEQTQYRPPSTVQHPPPPSTSRPPAQSQETRGETSDNHQQISPSSAEAMEQ